MIWITGIMAAGLAIVHSIGGRLNFLDILPRSIWLSLAGGASVAYVFVHILPDLNQHQKTLEQTSFLGLRFLETHVYLLALVGLSVFYGLERLAKQNRQKNRDKGLEEKTSPKVFALHMVSFAIYNFLIGYLLVHREVPGILNLVLYFVAMGLHFVVNDYALWVDHRHAYRQVGRWILASSILMGWFIGIQTQIYPKAIAVLFSFLAGGILLNVLKEELPEERQSRFWAFGLGAGLYTMLILAS